MIPYIELRKAADRMAELRRHDGVDPEATHVEADQILVRLVALDSPLGESIAADFLHLTRWYS